MLTYFLINIIFMLVVVTLIRILKIPIVKQWYVALIPLLLLTAIFDPLIIYFDIVGYDVDKTLGLRWLGAPIEDFMYSIMAIVMVPSLWNYFHKRGRTQHD